MLVLVQPHTLCSNTSNLSRCNIANTMFMRYCTAIVHVTPQTKIAARGRGREQADMLSFCCTHEPDGCDKCASNVKSMCFCVAVTGLNGVYLYGAHRGATTCTPGLIQGERLQEGTWANMVSNVRAGDKAQIRHQATRSAVGCSRPRWNCRPVALVSSCKPFLSTQQLPLSHPGAERKALTESQPSLRAAQSLHLGARCRCRTAGSHASARSVQVVCYAGTTHSKPIKRRSQAASPVHWHDNGRHHSTRAQGKHVHASAQ